MKNDLLQFLYIINHDLIIQWYGEHLDKYIDDDTISTK